MDAPSTDEIVVHEDGGLVVVELNRPDALNALTPTMVSGLRDVFAELHAEPPAGVLLTGRGRATCAGMDTDIVSQDYEADFGDVNADAQELYSLIDDLASPVVMTARGALIGIGLIISLSCDLLVAGTEATMSVPEVKYGIASEHMVNRLPDIVGYRVAAELILTGEPIAPQRAREIGLVNDVVAADAVEDRARELLATVAENDRETVSKLCRWLGEGRNGS